MQYATTRVGIEIVCGQAVKWHAHNTMKRTYTLVVSKFLRSLTNEQDKPNRARDTTARMKTTDVVDASCRSTQPERSTVSVIRKQDTELRWGRDSRQGYPCADPVVRVNHILLSVQNRDE